MEKIFKSSKAAGPLAKWVDSQVHFSTILESVDPLRKEVQDLQESLEALKSHY